MGYKVSRYDATNAVRFCDDCESEMGVGAGADKGDRACSCCGARDAHYIYPALSPAPQLTDEERSALLGATDRAAEILKGIEPGHPLASARSKLSNRKENE